jgi:CRISPR type I-E-associated protein CasB/Cse2
MNSTERYIAILTDLNPGDLGLLREHSGRDIDESVDGFDLFAGLWWPLRQKNERAPRREVAWLIAKLYAFSPIPPLAGETFARQMVRCQPHGNLARKRFQQRFDRLLLLPVDRLEYALQWALSQIANNHLKLDWVKLTNDLSQWGNERTRLAWSEQYIDIIERGNQC